MTEKRGYGHNEHENRTMKKWVDIVEFDAMKKATSLVIRCILENGAIRFEGNPALVKKIEGGIWRADEKKMVRPADGEAFLAALPVEFHSAYLFATEVQEGDEVKEYTLPPEEKL